MRRGDCYVCLTHFSALRQLVSHVLLSYHKIKSSFKISVRFYLQKCSMLPLTDSRNPCNPFFDIKRVSSRLSRQSV